MMASKPTARIAAFPGLVRRCLTSSLTYRVPSQPPYTNTATRKPATALPFPLTPDRLNQPLVMWTVPGWWPSTNTSPAMASPIRMRYSTAAMETWARAVILMPTTAMISMMMPTAAPMAMYCQVLVELEPNTASTEGPSSRTSATVPMMYAAIISQPVRKPR